jgi:hypothetical protein
MPAFAGNFGGVFRRFAIRAAILATLRGGASAKFVSAFFAFVVSHNISIAPY